MRYLRLALPALAAAALIAVAGCGGDDGGDELSAEEYASDVRRVLEQLGTELGDIGGVVREADDAEQLADSVQDAEGEIQGAVDELEEIEPPSAADGAHDLMIDALNTFNDALERLSDAAEDEDTEQIIAAASGLPAAVSELQRRLEQVRQELEEAGINVGA